MKKCIQVWSTDDEVKNFLKMQVFSEYNFEVLYVQSSSEAHKQIDNQKTNIVCIIGDYFHHPMNIASYVEHIISQDMKIPFILLCEEYPTSKPQFKNFLFHTKGNAYLKYPLQSDEFLEKFKEAVAVEFTSYKEKYRRIKSEKVQYFSKANFNIYILDAKNEYVPIKPDLDDLYEGDNEHYFVQVEDYKKFFHQISDRLRKKMFSSQLNTSQKIDLQLDVISKIQRTLQEVGLSTHEIQLAQASVDASIKILDAKPKISKILGKMMNYRTYTSELALMTGYLSTAIVMHTDWASNHSFQKLTMASLVQDMTLMEPELAIISSLNSEEYQKLSQEEKEKVLNHPLSSMKILDELDDAGDIANNIRNLVLNHHERPNGKGFPRHLTGDQFSVLSCIYILAHEFSHHMLVKRPTTESMEKLVANLKKDFSTYKFEKPFVAFRKVFKK